MTKQAPKGSLTCEELDEIYKEAPHKAEIQFMIEHAKSWSAFCCITLCPRTNRPLIILSGKLKKDKRLVKYTGRDYVSWPSLKTKDRNEPKQLYLNEINEIHKDAESAAVGLFF